MPPLGNKDMAFLDRNNGLINKGALESGKKPRICMLTTRGFDFRAFMCGFYEGQDILLDIDDVDLIYLEPKQPYELRRTLQEMVTWHDITNKIGALSVAFKPVTLTQDYDLFIAYLPYFFEIVQMPAIHGIKEHCKTSMCWINELWMTDVQNPKFARTWLKILDQFDHIALGLETTARGLSAALGRPCEFVPCGVDTLRFTPDPKLLAKSIDIYSMGRAWQGLHERFLEIAAHKHLFYLYDTFLTSGARVRDYRQHRDMLANIAKRTQYFVVAPAKVGCTDETGGQSEIGGRYFEAAAAGAILLGQAPQCAAFDELFNWPDAVVEILPDGSDAAEVLASLANQPQRLQDIGRRNAREALFRHDWVYRWKKILDIVGLEPSPRLAQRENTLAAMAQQIQVAEDSGSSANKVVQLNETVSFSA